MIASPNNAMEVAIRNVMPNTAHRWCKWHVLQNAKECLSTLYTGRNEFRVELHNMIDDTLTMGEFETAWGMLIEKYNLQSNQFMTRIYEVRTKWAKPYFRDVFFANMTSTEQRDSAKYMLKIYIPEECPMHKLVEGYMCLQFRREERESYEERRTKFVSMVAVNL
jgi:hypothetical protein